MIKQDWILISFCYFRTSVRFMYLMMRLEMNQNVLDERLLDLEGPEKSGQTALKRIKKRLKNLFCHGKKAPTCLHHLWYVYNRIF